MKVCSSIRRVPILRNTHNPQEHNPETITPAKPNTNLCLNLGIGRVLLALLACLKLSMCFNTLLD